MIILDVNVLIYAHRGEMPAHPASKALLDKLVDDDRAFGVPEMAFSSVVRIVTQPVWVPPSTTVEALEFCKAIRSLPKCHTLRPSENHWGIFDALCRVTRARGKLVADAYLAAFAIDRSDDWVTTDEDFHKFPGLRWRLLSEAEFRTNPR